MAERYAPSLIISHLLVMAMTLCLSFDLLTEKFFIAT